MRVLCQSSSYASGFGWTSWCVNFQSVGSLSSSKSFTPPAPAAPVREAMCCIQRCTKSGAMIRDMSCGSFPVIALPSGRFPLPASAVHQNAPPVTVHSVCCCAPYLATE